MRGPRLAKPEPGTRRQVARLDSGGSIELEGGHVVVRQHLGVILGTP